MPKPGFHVWFLDVGQGDAILIQTPLGKQILVDGGPGDRVIPELGRYMPFWDRTIEQVILTHNHADHLSGLVEVARRYTLESVWTSGAIHTTPEYLAWLTTLKERNIPLTIVSAGTSATVDDVNLSVIYPFTDQTGIRPENQHDATLVTRLVYQELSMLLTGDLEESHENELVESARCDGEVPCVSLAAMVLKVPHHGSKTGLIPTFLEAVKPDIAVISSGRNNSYGHPAPSILERLATAEVETYRTDQDGTIELTYLNNQLAIKRVRDK